MTITSIDDSQRKAARVAGFAYLFSLAIEVTHEFFISPRLNVAGNAAETARNILAHESLFRLGIACDLIYAAGTVLLLTALYVILKPVSRNLALLATFWRLIYAVTWVVVALNLFTALRLLSGAEYLQAFGAEQLQALARLHVSGFDTYYVGLLFYGLASTACAYLWLKSRYIPRGLAAWGVIASAWCAICTFFFIISPGFSKVVNLWWFDSPMGIFEIATSFWLLFKGLSPSEIPAHDRPGNRAHLPDL
jgi:Domain of unknown function (DUF4386)